jgi:peptide/nickel transport system substrate-binding protein
MVIKTCIRNTILSLLVLPGTMAGTIACTRHLPADDAQTLVVALSALPSTLDPTRATDATSERLAGLLFSSIVKVGPDLKIVGEAATAWSYKNRTWTFQLRPGLVFANGRPVSAADIDFSFKKFLSAGSPFAAALKSISSVEVRYDDQARELKLHLSEYAANLLTELSPVKILPQQEMESLGADFTRKLIGTGPFTFVSQDENEIRLLALPQHPYAAPKIQNLVFKIVRDDNTRVLKIMKGEIDIAQQELPPSRIAELEKLSTLKVFKYPGLGMSYVLLNLRDPRLAKLELRRALAMGVNRDEIVRYKLNGLATPATSLLSPVSPYHDFELKPVAFTPDQARAVIAKLGLKGARFVLKTSSTPSAVENGRVIANQLSALGLDVSVQSFEWGTFYGDVQKGNFELATMRWVGVVDPDLYRSAFHSKELPPLGRNRGGYKNQRFDGLVEAGLRIENQSERIRHYRQVQKAIFDDLPIIPLWYDQEIAVVHQRVKDYEPPVNGDYSVFTRVSKEGSQREAQP